jgi:DNA processing protein
MLMNTGIRAWRSGVNKGTLDNLEKSVVLSRLFRLPKLLERIKRSSSQYSLFSIPISSNIDELFFSMVPDGITNDEYKKVKSLIETHKENGIEIINIFSHKYPPRLREIDDPPFLLYVKGSIKTLGSKCVAIVGTREASQYGLDASYSYSKYFAERGFCIVSGLALGIDARAHRGALDAKGETVAILAAGLDYITPPDNIGLAQEIVKKQGLLISEHPLGYPPAKFEYIRRNRLQSGMSMCSLIVESSPESGSARQAEYSYKQGKKIFVIIPDEITSQNSDFKLSGAHSIVHKFKATALMKNTGYLDIDNYLHSVR